MFVCGTCALEFALSLSEAAETQPSARHHVRNARANRGLICGTRSIILTFICKKIAKRQEPPRCLLFVTGVNRNQECFVRASDISLVLQQIAQLASRSWGGLGMISPDPPMR